MNSMRDALLCLGLLFVIGFMIYGIASITVIPMRNNYRECGTIFICANQK